jgi:hypothetical protein
MASEDETLALYQRARESGEKFEYYLLGLTLALCAYEGKTLTPEKLGLNAYTIEVVSISLLIGSIIIGFKHVQAMIATSALNHLSLSLEHQRSRLAKGEPMYEKRTGELLNEQDRAQAAANINREFEEAERELNKVLAKSGRLSSWRIWLLIAGFIGLVLSKVLVPYLANG